MRKQEFLDALKSGLTGLPQEDIGERLTFYGEMIDDRMEEGLSEEDAVAAIGPVEQVINEIVAETPLTKLVKERIKPKRRLRAWEIVMLVIGFPLWFPLTVAALLLVVVFYLVLWVLVICLWAVETVLWAAALFGLVAAVLYTLRGYVCRVRRRAARCGADADRAFGLPVCGLHGGKRRNGEACKEDRARNQKNVCRKGENKMKKGAVITAVVLIVLGLSLFIGGLAAGGSFQPIEVQEKTYTVTEPSSLRSKCPSTRISMEFMRSVSSRGFKPV